MRRTLAATLLTLASAGVACRGGTARPADLDTHNEICRSCRMPVSDPRLAAQLAAPGEEALFFDDIGCLRDWLSRNPHLEPGAVAYVADHRSARWIPAADARFFRCPSIDTPMGSHLIAVSGAATRATDGVTCSAVSAVELFGPDGPPRGRPGERP